MSTTFSKPTPARGASRADNSGEQPTSSHKRTLPEAAASIYPEPPTVTEQNSDRQAKSRKLPKDAWKYVIKSTIQRFTANQTTDLAAGLTYFTVSAIFPALLAIVSIAQLAGLTDRVMPMLEQTIKDTIPNQDAANQVISVVDGFLSSDSAGLALIIGILVALWSASAYVAAFSRAANKIYDVTEGRNPIRLKAVQFGTTIVIVVGAVIGLVLTAISGSVARWLGELIGLGDTAVMVWEIAKWPVLILLMIFMVALLYYVSPNIAQPTFRWLSAGSITAVIVAIVAVLGFGFYVSNFGNYNKTYGALAGVIIALLLIWLVNTVLLFGATLGAETERVRQLNDGLPAERGLVLPVRDATNIHKLQEKADQIAMEGHQIRERALRDGARRHPELEPTERD